jgi:hypothetical protein
MSEDEALVRRTWRISFGVYGTSPTCYVRLTDKKLEFSGRTLDEAMRKAAEYTREHFNSKGREVEL